jgi:methylmalonyl-CoA/ethylmalonyl-CoA epimerase
MPMLGAGCHSAENLTKAEKLQGGYAMPKKLNHIAILVENLEEGLRPYCEDLGLKVGGVETFGNQVKVAFLPLANTQLELLQPLSPEGRAGQRMKEKGPGLYHICFEVESISETMQELKSRGVRFLNEKPLDGAHGSKIAFVDPERFGGVLVELCQPGNQTVSAME